MKGGSLASDSVVSAVDCNSFENMNSSFDNHVTINLFRGGALIKSDDISYKIFNEQIGGADCTSCANAQSSAPTAIGSMTYAPPLAAMKGMTLSTQDMYADTKGVLPSMYQHISDYPVRIDGVSYPESYNAIPNMSLYNLSGGKKRCAKKC